jgi:CRP-like cAMP-binding protein
MAINKVEFLKQIDLFKNFSDKELEEIAKYFHEKHYNKNDYLFFEEDAEPGIFILVDGLIKLLKETPDGKTIIVRLVFPKEIFGWIEFGGKKTQTYLHCPGGITFHGSIYVKPRLCKSIYEISPIGLDDNLRPIGETIGNL